MSLMTNQLAQTLRPIGEVEKTSNFMVIVPASGMDYYPVLLHCDYKNITRATHELLKNLVEIGPSPIVVITNGNQAKIAVEIASYLAANELVGLFNGVLSMNNERFGFLQGFATYWNNLPFQMEEALASTKFLGKYTDIGNGLAETLGSLFDVPVISTHFIGAEQDYLDIKEFLSVMSTEYPTYSYKDSIHLSPQNFTRPRDDNRCVCCHKTGDNLGFFAKIQGKLCPRCIRKMKNMPGGVSIFNWYTLGMELKAERMNSNTANNLRAWQKEPICTECGTKLTAKGHHEYHCDACGTTLWYKNMHYFRIRTIYGTEKLAGGKTIDVVVGRHVHKISDDGKSLVGSWSLDKCPELVTCSDCGKLCVDFSTQYEASTNTTRFVCKKCLSQNYSV